MDQKDHVDNRELFKGLAETYARFRQGYPKEFFDYVVKYYQLDGRGRLLDLGCGTGQIAIPLAPYFAEAVGLDVDIDMLNEAKRQVEKAGIKNTRWILKKAEDVSEELGIFRLATFGASFHWMEQDRVLAEIYKILEPNGGLVIVSGSSSIWRNVEKEPWKDKCKEVIQKYLGEKRRAGNSFYAEPKDKFEEVLARSPFRNFEQRTYGYEREITIEEIIGRLYTTSFAQKRFFGDRLSYFEDELRSELLKISPVGKVTEKLRVEALLTHKPR